MIHKKSSVTRKKKISTTEDIHSTLSVYYQWCESVRSYFFLRRRGHKTRDNRTLKVLQKQIFFQYFKYFFLFPVWIVRFLTPGYLKGEVTLWTNLKTIFTSREFRPLRIAVASQIVFLYMVFHLGLLVLQYFAAPVYAATYTWVQSVWSGGVTSTVALHPGDSTGWSAYLSVSSTMSASSSVALIPVSVSSTFTSDSDFGSGSFSNTIVEGAGTGAYVRLTGGIEDVNNWDPALANLPGTVGADAQMIRNGSDDYIYVLRGAGTGFYRYTISTNSWDTLTAVPGSVGVGAKMLRTGSENFIYVLAGGGTTNFYRYTISTDSWVTLSGPSGTINDGPNMVRYGDYIYAMRGGGVATMYYYSISGGTWAARDSMTTGASTGAQMITNGSDGYIYATRGTAGTGFYRYSVAGNSWSTMASVPGTPGDGSYALRSGSDGNIYLLRGGGTTDVYRYSIAGNSWTTLAALPGAAGAGAQMIRNGTDNEIYVLRGGGSPSFYRYSVSGNSWTTLPSLPEAAGTGAQMIRNGTDNYIYVLRGGSSNELYQYVFQREEYDTPGTFTSAVVDTGGNAGFTTLSFTSSSPSNTVVSVDVRAGNTASPDETWTAWETDIVSGGDISNLGNRRYFQYRVHLSTSNTALTPSFLDGSVYYLRYTEGSLISSPFDANDPTSVFGGVSWQGTTPTDTSIRFQIRTSPNNSSWTVWMGPDGTSDSFFTASDGSQDSPAVLSDGSGDQYIQYRVTLEGSGTDTPVLTGTTMTYVVNAPPEIEITTSTIQSASGLVEVPYRVRDFDTSTGATPGSVSIELQYCTSQCSDVGNEVWQTANTSTLSGSYGPGIVVASVDYTEYTVVWNPKLSYNNQYNGTDFKIRLRANDGEGANNIDVDESNVFVLDTTDPVVTNVLLDARSDAMVPLSISVTDDTLTGLMMNLSNHDDLSPDGVNQDSGTWIPYAPTSSWVFASGPTSSVHYRIRDAYGNISSGGAVSSVFAPATPQSVVIRDISNAAMSEWWEFIAWTVVPPPVAGFKQYTIYRSTDGITYSVHAIETDRLTNYYFDQNLDTETTYYYKIVAEDQDDGISKYSSIVSDTPNGQGGTDTTPPTISNVTITEIGTQSAVIEWDTDELADSYVDYTSVSGGDFSSADSVGRTSYSDSSSGVGRHTVVLSGLSPSTTYYFRVRSRDVQGSEGVSTSDPDGYTFTTLSGPSITDVSVSQVYNTRATITWTTDQVSDSYVRYSTFPDMSSSTLVGTAESVTSHVVELSHLTRGTTYYFLVQSGVAQDTRVVDGEKLYYVFTTTEDVTAPSVIFDPVTDVSLTEDSIGIVWTTDEVATSTLEYGTSDQYGSTELNTQYNMNHSVLLNNLLPGTPYYFRFVVSDVHGNVSGATEFVATTTASADIVPPAISNVTTSVITDTDAVIVWTTDESADGRVYYGTATSTYTVSSSLVSTYNRDHAIMISGLTTSTEYFYIVVSADMSGNITTSSEYSFTTREQLSEESEVLLREEAARAQGLSQGQARAGGGGGGSVALDTTPPVVAEVFVSSVRSDSAMVTWSTLERANSIVEFGTSTRYGRAAVNLENTTDHAVVLIDLIPSTEYFYRISSIDTSGNLSDGYTGAFRTISFLEEHVSSTESMSDDVRTNSSTTDTIFLDAVQKAGELIKSLSTQVSVGVLESTLLEQTKAIEELSNILPLPLIGGQPLVETGSSYATISWTTDKDANSFVQYADQDTFSTTQSYAQIVGDPYIRTQSHSVNIIGLAPDTVYRYRVISRTPMGSETISRDFTFRTRAEVSEIVSYRAEVVSQNEARFTWVSTVPTDSLLTITPYRNGVLALEARQSVRNTVPTTQHVLTVSDLEMGVVYEVELSGRDSGGTTVSRVIRGFTLDGEDVAPILSQIRTEAAIIPGSKEKIQVIISWMTNELSTSRVYYRKGFARGEHTSFTDSSIFDQNYTRRHISVLTNFEPGQVYQFQVESIDSSGNVGLSQVMTILTPQKEQSVFQVIFSNFEQIFSWVGKIR